MVHAVTRQVVDAFYDAYATGDRDKLETMLHDDVVWSIHGPVAVMRYCGERHGKAQVLELAAHILPSVLADMKIVHQSVVLSGDEVATLNRLTARRRSDGRSIGYRFSHFLRFKDGKVIETLSIIDTYDAAEQMLGHPLAVRDETTPGADNLVML